LGAHAGLRDGDREPGARKSHFNIRISAYRHAVPDGYVQARVIARRSESARSISRQILRLGNASRAETSGVRRGTSATRRRSCSSSSNTSPDFGALQLELEVRLKRAVHRAGPPGAKRAVIAGDLKQKGMLEAADALGRHRIGAVGEAQRAGESVVHASPQRRRHAVRRDFDRKATFAEIPQQQIDIVDRLLKNPRADAIGRDAPIAGTGPEGTAKQREIGIAQASDRVFGNQLAHACPLPGDAQFQTDPEVVPRALGGGHDPFGLGQCGCHRLLEQDMLAGVQRRHRHRRVQMVGHDDVDELDRPIAQRPDLNAPETGRLLKGKVKEGELRPLFKTIVRRTVIELEPRQSTRVEAAIDEGEIRGIDGNAVEPVSEIELELKSGERAALYEVALQLLDVAPLRIETRSKSERGYTLVGVDGGRPQPVQVKPVTLEVALTVEAVLQRIGRTCLTHLLWNEPAALADQPEGIHQMRVAVRRLRSVLSTLEEMLPADDYRWTSDELKQLERRA
jgi:hypothetical protein